MEYRCPRCNSVLASKERLKGHIKRKRRCKVVEDGKDMSVEELLEYVKNTFVRKQVQQIRLVKKGFDKIKWFLRYKVKPTEPLSAFYCLEKIKITMENNPKYRIILPTNNVSQLKMFIGDTWVYLPIRKVFSKIWTKYIDNPDTNDYHYSHFSNKHPKHWSCEKSFKKLPEYDDRYINEKMRKLFGAKRFSNWRSEEQIEADKIEKLEQTLKEIHFEKQMKEIEKARKNKKADEEWINNEKKIINLRDNKRCIDKSMKILEKSLKNKIDLCNKDELNEMLINEIVEDYHNIGKLMLEQISLLKEEDRYYVFDTYFENMESQLIDDINPEWIEIVKL